MNRESIIEKACIKCLECPCLAVKPNKNVDFSKELNPMVIKEDVL